MTRNALLKMAAAVAVLALIIVGLATTVLGGGTEHQARFVHASGLRAGDAVRVAGIPSGHVTSIRLDGADAVVSFELDGGLELHTDATAAVKMATLLGQNYLEVVPGHGAVTDRAIPTSRTTPAYTVSDVVTQTNETVGSLDLDAIDQAVGAMATTLDQDPKQTDAALRGATRLARTIGQKDAQVDRLLTHVHDVTSMVRAQQDDLDELLGDADTVASLVARRRDTVKRLLTTAEDVTAGLERLAAANTKGVSEVLDQFHAVLGVLRANAEKLDRSLERLAPMARYFANATGNGPWIDVYAPFFLLPDKAVCALDPGSCR
jgi:phospholipid/cholesterol/gamma-HCH transport system substrate-binding protein